MLFRSVGDAPRTAGIDGAVAHEMASVNKRLFNNAYFRSIDALLLLASFRLATLLEWLPWLLAFAAAVMIDGYFVRLIKSKEFLQHDPEIFALWGDRDGLRDRARVCCADHLAPARDASRAAGDQRYSAERWRVFTGGGSDAGVVCRVEFSAIDLSHPH